MKLLKSSLLHTYALLIACVSWSSLAQTDVPGGEKCFPGSEDADKKEELVASSSSSGESQEDDLTNDPMSVQLNLFLNLYENGKDKNTFFSPYSIHQALMMASFAASNKTYEELQNALMTNGTSKQELVDWYKLSVEFFKQSRSESVDLSIATRIYVDDSEKVRSCVEDMFKEELSRIDFKNANATEEINAWVRENTREKIPEFLPQGTLTPMTRMALVNSAYFKGMWNQQFKKSNTKLGAFFVNKKEQIIVPYMNQKGSFRHGISEKLRAYILEMPYEDESLSMFILLPPYGLSGTTNEIAETIKRLNTKNLREAMEETIQDAIEVKIPKFHIEQSFDLTKNLKSLGIEELFSENADLSDFFEDSGIQIDTAIHKSYIEVNEEGSTAAAVTSLIGTRSSRPLDQTRFFCTHPFIFFIHDNKTKNILFMGAIHRPEVDPLSKE